MSDAEKPKYLKLKEYIIENIYSAKLKSGDKIQSENELVEEFEISRHTVRHALGELVSEGWLYKEHGKGTFIAERPKKPEGGSKNIGVITTYLNDYIFPTIIRGMDNILASCGYNIMLSCTYNTHEKERICLENLKQQNIAGLIVEPTKSALPNPNLKIYKELKDRGIPIVFIHGCYKDIIFPQVVEDDEKAGYLATRHLIELGHSKIAGIFKIDDVQGHQRFAGFQRAHTEAGLIIPDNRILWFDTGEIDDKFTGVSSNKLVSILKNGTSVVCYNEQIAIKVMDAARALDLIIPEQLSIVSFDDSQLAVASEIKLTTIAHPKEKLGEQAARTIIDLIEGRKIISKFSISPQLVVRTSSRKVN